MRFLRRRRMTHDCLSSEAQGFDDGPVAFDVVVLNIVQEPAAPSDHHQEPSTGVVILFMGFQVFGQVCNPVGEKSYLNLR